MRLSSVARWLAFLCCSSPLALPVAAQHPPVVPILTSFGYWDHHWIQWLPTHLVSPLRALAATTYELMFGRKQ